MADLNEAIATATDAVERPLFVDSVPTWILRDLLAALDAARGRVAGESCADHFPGETGYVTFSARVPHGTKLFAAPPAAAVPDMATIRGVVARGWCHKETEGKEMDVTLAECIAAEVRAMLAANKENNNE